MKTKDISGAELTVMKVLWEADRAMTVHDEMSEEDVEEIRKMFDL